MNAGDPTRPDSIVRQVAINYSHAVDKNQAQFEHFSRVASCRYKLVGDCDLVLGTFGQSEASIGDRHKNVSLTQYIGHNRSVSCMTATVGDRSLTREQFVAGVAGIRPRLEKSQLRMDVRKKTQV
jgi:hypothetical protein